jgi:hypothetical protein
MTTTEDETNTARCCSYCLLPPKVIGKKLKSCSRCHNAWYHDADCQKKHFSVHKKECHRQQQQQRQITTSANSNNNNNNNYNGSPEFDVQERKGRGKCLVALSKLRKGQRIIPSKLKPQSQLSVEDDKKKKKRDFWRPLILPVLHEEYRTTRCALCFNQLHTESSCTFHDDSGTSCSSSNLLLLSSSSSSSSSNNQNQNQNQNQNNRNYPSPLYVLLFCSKSCREVAANTNRHYNLDQEEQVVGRLLENGNGPPRILSTAILLYRILIHESNNSNNNNNNNDTYIRDQVRQLQSKKTRRTDIEFDTTSTTSNNDDNDNESSNNLHTQGVIATVMGMFQYSSELSLPYKNPPSMEDLVDMVHKIKVNGFSIYGGEEFTAYGVGIFGTPSYMNHSCRPNVLQTFLFQQGKPPSFYVTVFQDIEPNEEICISYTDTSCPKHIRRKRLNQEYYFLCTCEACDNSNDDNGGNNRGGSSNIAKTNDDSRTIGIRCQDCKKSSVVIRVEERMAPTRPSPVYRCTECNKTDFESALKLLRDFDDQISKRGYSKICRPTLNSSTDDMNKTYKSLKNICNMDSWYVQEAGENVLQYYLNELSMQRDNPLQEQQTAWRALKIAEELLVDDTSSLSLSSSFLTTTKDTLTVSTSAFLKYQQLRYKAAKLRLFLVPDPRQSIRDLEIVLKSLSPFFPSDHELIIGLKACLANAMM